LYPSAIYLSAYAFGLDKYCMLCKDEGKGQGHTRTCSKSKNKFSQCLCCSKNVLLCAVLQIKENGISRTITITVFVFFVNAKRKGIAPCSAIGLMPIGNRSRRRFQAVAGFRIFIGLLFYLCGCDCDRSR
jgi:hypothetical protein